MTSQILPAWHGMFTLVIVHVCRRGRPRGLENGGLRSQYLWGPDSRSGHSRSGAKNQGGL